MHLLCITLVARTSHKNTQKHDIMTATSWTCSDAEADQVKLNWVSQRILLVLVGCLRLKEAHGLTSAMKRLGAYHAYSWEITAWGYVLGSLLE